MINNLTPQQKIDIYKHLFYGREDVFAVYWEKADKSASGYTPVCLNEWKSGLCNKLQKKKCKDCENQNYASLNDTYIEQHLRGHKSYGIYPLLEDSTSYFVAADFDGETWQKDVLKFYKKCQKYSLSTCLERSRSGNGCHAWLFFEDRYLAHKSRNIFVNILKEAKIIDQFDHEDSFDRLFPNQDNLSGQGFGNLIALPLQGEARKQDNTVFLNPEDKLKPLKDQWGFLQQIKKIALKKLDKLYEQYNQDSEKNKSSSKSLITINIREQLFISKSNLPKILINFLKNKLNFLNSEYLIKKKIGVNVYGMEKYFKLIQTNDSNIAIPRGFLNELTKFLNEQFIKFKIIDKRVELETVNFTSNLKLFDYQKEALNSMLAVDGGILVAPPGSGKTIIGLELITRLQQPSLILVHKRQIFSQWVERIESFLSIPKREIGQLCSNKKKIGDKITVAMIQTLNKSNNFEELIGSKEFGLVLVDECHHIPAKTFREVITNLRPYYLYGLTATPKRKHNDEKLIFIYLGEILHSIDNDFQEQKTESVKVKNKVVIRNTDIEIPFKIKVDNFQVLSKIIIFDSRRNQQIVNDITGEVNKNFKCLVLTERKEHVEVLSYYLKKEYEIITLTGDLTEKQRKEKIKQIEGGNFQILIATGQLIGEGTDFPNLDCLFLVYPFAFQGKLTQYIGRIQRGQDKHKTIYDYRDIRIEYLEKFFKKRKAYYKKTFGTKID